MGYDHDWEDDYGKPKRRKKGRWPLLVTAFLSSMLGAITAILLLPYLVERGVVPSSVYSAVAPPQHEAVAVPSSSPNGATEGEPSTSTQRVVQVKIETDTVQAVRKVEKAVVGVVNIQQIRDFWTSTTMAVESGTGSGVIFRKQNGKAWIVTNYHVIKGASDIEISLADGNRVMGRVLGSDPLTDLAVLEVDARHVQDVAEFGSSAHLQAGEPAIAIGNPLGLEFSRSVTQGIISSLNRSMPIDLDEDGQPEWDLDVIQTDAAINPGNSGGALINMAGEVIGINTLKISKAGIEGLGFAIPIDDAKPIIEDLVRYGKVKRPYIGITPRDLQQIPSYHWRNTLKLPEQVTEGVVILEVFEGAAYKAGLRQYDVIVSLDDQMIGDSAALRKYMYTKKQRGSTVKVTYYRNGEVKSTIMELTTGE